MCTDFVHLNHHHRCYHKHQYHHRHHCGECADVCTCVCLAVPMPSLETAHCPGCNYLHWLRPSSLSSVWVIFSHIVPLPPPHYLCRPHWGEYYTPRQADHPTHALINKEGANWYPTNIIPPPPTPHFMNIQVFKKKDRIQKEGSFTICRVERGLLKVLFPEQRVCHHNTEPDLLSHFFSHQFSYWNFNVNDIPHLSCPVNPPVMSCRSQDNEQLSGIIHHSSPYFVLITQEHQGRLKLVIFC